jgi:hypothetical protein
MSNEPKVYIINSAGHDYSKAERFGELIVLSEGSLPVFAVDRIRLIYEKGLQEYDSERDFLLLSGNLIPNVIATGVAIMKSGGHISVLIFDAKRRVYIERQLDFSRVQTTSSERGEYSKTRSV